MTNNGGEMNEKFLDSDQNKFSMDSSKKSFKSSLILWITFGLSLIVTVLLYMQSKSVQNSVDDKQQQRDEIVSQLESPSYTQIENKANSFKEAFDIFSQISNSQLPKKDLMKELYTYFTKDTKISNLSLTNSGVLNIDGYSSSYRSVADFMVALKSYNRVTEVKLGTVGQNLAEDATPKTAMLFSVSAKVNTAKVITSSDSQSISGDDSDTSQSGSETDYTDEPDEVN